jgi:hypothetical protein
LFWIYGGGFQSGSAKFEAVIETGFFPIKFENVANGSDFAQQGDERTNTSANCDSQSFVTSSHIL